MLSSELIVKLKVDKEFGSGEKRFSFGKDQNEENDDMAESKFRAGFDKCSSISQEFEAFKFSSGLYLPS